ncbi:hypothetical protein BDW59DRAFT_140589 [Aspergillus cavernicola]|uniref:Uncharacterized protein n=1 Tax=Aspergillus cavernicola TaxID=176166 RepID=A0ABR4ITS8_9EURO
MCAEDRHADVLLRLFRALVGCRLVVRVAISPASAVALDASVAYRFCLVALLFPISMCLYFGLSTCDGEP